MAARHHKTVAVSPCRISAANLQMAQPQNGGNVGQTQCHTRVTRIGGLYFISSKAAQGICCQKHLVRVKFAHLINPLFRGNNPSSGKNQVGIIANLAKNNNAPAWKIAKMGVFEGVRVQKVLF
jgi:hypothetical protein